MKLAVTDGVNMESNPFIKKRMVVRTEKTNNFATLSIADDDEGVMLQIVVSEEVKKLLKDIVN